MSSFNLLVERDYSILHCYHYSGKSLLLRSLDVLSMPFRSVFGGRSVCILSQTTQESMSKMYRVAAICAVVVVCYMAPVWVIAGVGVSALSLFVKHIIALRANERNQVKVLSQELCGIINQFDDAIAGRRDDEVMHIFRGKPHIRRNTEHAHYFYTCIHRKINRGTAWVEIIGDLQLLAAHDAIRLINHAIRVRLADEFERNHHETAAHSIIELIEKTFSGGSRGFQSIEACFKGVLSGALQVDVNEDILLSSIKMDIADQMIRSLVQAKKVHAQNRLASLRADIEEESIKSIIFKKEQNYLVYYLLFSTPEREKVSKLVAEIRSIHHMGSQCLKKWDLSTPQTKEESWQSNYQMFKAFREYMDQVQCPFDEGEEIYIQSLKKAMSIMIRLIEDVRWEPMRNVACSVRETEKCFDEQIERCRVLLEHAKKSVYQTGASRFIVTLHLRRQEELWVLTKKMKAFLIVNVVPMAVEMLYETR